MGVFMCAIIFIVFVMPIFYFLGKPKERPMMVMKIPKSSKEIAELDETAMAMAEMSIMTYEDATPSVYWTTDMAKKLQEDKPMITLKVAHYLRSAIDRSISDLPSEKNMDHASALIIYYSLGYDDYYDDKQNTIQSIIKAYSADDIKSISKIQSQARIYRESKQISIFS